MRTWLLVFGLVWGVFGALAEVVLVDEGRGLVQGIFVGGELGEQSAARLAAADLAMAVERMTGVVVPVVLLGEGEALPEGSLVALGRLADEAGAGVKAKSLWRDSRRVVVGKGRILVSGESDMAVNAGVMDLLHEVGVRWFMPANLPGDPGTVMPEVKRLAWADRDEELHPHIRGRRVWGHNLGDKDWKRESNGKAGPVWVRRTVGESAVDVPSVHAWNHLLPMKDRKPEHSAIKRYGPDGEPVRGGQYCVSHPEVTELVSASLVKKFGEHPEEVALSVAPNDGGGACICLDCARLDPAGYVEPSSGRPVLSDRYLWLFNRLAERVSKEYPDRYLAYLVYSDYSRVPRRVESIHPMIMPIVAPIRYCRLHGMFNEGCEQNMRLRWEAAQYAKMATQIGYYGYNYNLAELVAPFSKLGTWSEDLPYLAGLGMMQATMETIGNWNTNGPHIYLASRYVYSGEEPGAILDDYFEKLGGAAAEPLRAYWESVDLVYMGADIHSGSFYGIEQILTEEVLDEWHGYLAAAEKAAVTEREKAVVALFASGLEQGTLVARMLRAMNEPDFAKAAVLRDELNVLNTRLEKEGVVSIYPNRYMRWFVDHIVDSGAELTADGGQVVQVLPQTWGYRPDPYDAGLEERWFDPVRVSRRFLPVKQWGAPSMYSQGHGDWKGYQWLRVEVTAPKDVDGLHVWFGANDGTTRLWINGEEVPFTYVKTNRKTKETTSEVVLEYPKSWRSFSAEVGRYLRAGEQNTFVVRLDHRLNDLNLGGLLRPVVLFKPGKKGATGDAGDQKVIDM